MTSIEYRQYSYIFIISLFIWLLSFTTFALTFLMLGSIVFEEEEEYEIEYGGELDIDLYEIPWYEYNWMHYYDYTLYYSKYLNKSKRDIKGLECGIVSKTFF